MKKLLVSAMTVFLILSLCACGGEETDKDTSGIAPAFSDSGEGEKKGKPLSSLKNRLKADEESGEIENTDFRYWSGGWYGYWTITSPKGAWEMIADAEGNWWDGCARIEMEDAATGHITFWSEPGTGGHSEEEPILDCDVSFDRGSTKAGAMTSEGGSFYEDAIARGELRCDPGTGAASGYEHMICITGTYEESEEDGFDYEIYLRPWGMEWEDVDTDGAEVWRPYYYSDWYLPAVQAGMELSDAMAGGGIGTVENQEEAAYEPLLDRIYTLILDEEGEEPDYEDEYGLLGIWEAAHYSEAPLERIGYTMEDFSGDGIPELIVGEIRETGEYEGGGSVYACYTLVDGAPRLSISGLYRDGFYSTIDNGTFYYVGSAGAGYTAIGIAALTFDGTDLCWEEFYYTDWKDDSYSELVVYGNSSGIWFGLDSYLTDMTEEEFGRLAEEWNARTQPLDLTPFSALPQ